MNHFVTSDVFFHWLSFVVFLIFDLILSRICLLPFPSSLFVRFMRRHVRWLTKLSLWSFKPGFHIVVSVVSVVSVVRKKFIGQI